MHRATVMLRNIFEDFIKGHAWVIEWHTDISRYSLLYFYHGDFGYINKPLSCYFMTGKGQVDTAMMTFRKIIQCCVKAVGMQIINYLRGNFLCVISAAQATLLKILSSALRQTQAILANRRRGIINQILSDFMDA